MLDQLNVALPPTAILAGVAASETVGTAGGVTATVADAWDEPVGPVQVSAYVVVAAGDTAREPPVPRPPVQPPEAMQAVAFLVDQFSMEIPPELMVLGVADNVTAGVPDGWTVSTADDDEADPAAPLQVRV